MSAETRDSRFLLGLLAGSCIGIGLALWLAPRAGEELRQRLADSARDLGDRASEGYNALNARVDGAVEDLTKRRDGVRDGMADAVMRGAKDVARAIKS